MTDVYSVSLEDLPLIEGEELGLVGPDVAGLDIDRSMERRSLLKLAMAGGAFVGMMMLGLFSNVRRAAAQNNYVEHGAGTLGGSFCGSYDPDTWGGYDGSQNGYRDPGGVGECDDDACVGAPDLYMGKLYCATCGEIAASPSTNFWGWHMTGNRFGNTLGDYTPDICYNPQAGFSADAWRWEISTCEGCTPAVYRCHDGWKQEPDSTNHFTICQGLVVCNGSLHDPC